MKKFLIGVFVGIVAVVIFNLFSGAMELNVTFSKRSAQTSAMIENVYK